MASPSSPVAAADDPPRLPLRHFVVGPENALVRIAADAVIEGSDDFNPLLFFGPSGTGKSFLLQGLAAGWKALHPNRPLINTTAADFAREYADAVDTDALPDFRARYQRAGLIVLDGIEHLARKTSAQQELIRILEAVTEGSTRVLASASRTLTDISGLLPPLIGRLACGLTVPLVPPGPATRYVILQRLAQAHSVPLSQEIIRLLVNTDQQPGSMCPRPLHTVPQLQHAVLHLRVLAEQQGVPLTITAAKEYLEQRRAVQRPSLRSITALVARYFHQKSAELKGPGRRQGVVQARGIAMYLSRKFTDKSLQQVGRHFGNRDHTTVLHACRKIESLLEQDPLVRQAVEELATQVAGADVDQHARP